MTQLLADPQFLHPDQMDATSARILDAALAQFVHAGLRNTTMESVARAAGLSHMTVYRRWGSRAELEQAVVIREARRLFALLDERGAQFTDPEERLVEGFVALFQFARSNPLLHLVETDPEIVLPMLTTRVAPVFAVARSYLADHLRRAQAAGAVGEFDAEGVAEVLVRVTHSLVLVPESSNPLETDADVRAFAVRYLAPLIRSTRTTS
jgi:AcrR family transcriptional regulator